MKILNLEKNERGQIIATVLNCGKEFRIAAGRKDELPKIIAKVCYFTAQDDVKLDLELNYADFK